MATAIPIPSSRLRDFPPLSRTHSAAEHLHTGLYRVVYVSLSNGNVMDLYKDITWEMGLPTERSQAALYRQIKGKVTRLCAEARCRLILIVDEAWPLGPMAFARHVQTHSQDHRPRDRRPLRTMER